MRVSVSVNLNEEPDAGRRKFIHRLAGAMARLGVEIVDRRADVHLFLPTHEPSASARVNVLRLDGLYTNRGPWPVRKNMRIRRAAERADAVVFQNEFCREAYARFLGFRPALHAEILNGADPAEFAPRAPRDFFLANANWKPMKRLDVTIAAFEMALERGLDAELWITGEPDERREHPRVRYLGWQTAEQLRELLAGAIASVHLGWLDACPNAMVEAVVAGCPVIYTTSGGHPYIGEGAGIAIADAVWDYHKTESQTPPPIDVEPVVEAMLRVRREPPAVHRPDLFIDAIARQYAAFFQQVLTQLPRGKRQGLWARWRSRVTPLDLSAPAFQA